MTEPGHEATRSAIEAVWRIESPRLIAGLARITGDVGAAEELAQDALVIALEQWPVRGVPDGPGAWLMATAKHRAIDLIRRRASYERKLQEIGRDAALRPENSGEPDVDAMDDHIGDDLLRLIFISCHPVLSPEARAALTLRLLGGLTTAEIARAFLVPEATIAQRIVRAKRTLTARRVPFELPPRAEIPGRLTSVLEVIYLMFNEGYAATGGSDWMRPALCAEAMRLGRVLAGLMTREAEAHGLVALMELQASRVGARTDPAGEPVLLADQDRRRWDRLLIRHGLQALARARSLGGPPGPLRGAGRDRRLPRAGALGAGDRLGAGRRAVRGARPPDAVAGRRAEPGGRRRHGVRPGPRAGDRGQADRASGPGVLRPPARGARRPAGQAGPGGRGPGGVRPGRRADR